MKPNTNPYEAIKILSLIANALTEGGYSFTSLNSIEIPFKDSTSGDMKSIEVNWHIHD
jgi:hypothetical protein